MIEVRDLTKDYGTVRALAGVSFSVPKGQVVGFLGPNGAGKTTTMKILTGYLAPTSGTATVAGFDVVADPIEAQRRIGYLPEGNPLYTELRVEEALRFASDMHGLPRSGRDAAIGEVLDAAGLTERRRSLISHLSKGYRQRVGLAQALLHRPEVLILDEPTSGLDPNQQQEMRTLIRALGRERTVILSSHILPEVEAVCDRVLIVHEGLVVAEGTVEEIRERAAGRAAVVAVVRGSLDAARDAFADFPGAEGVEVEPIPSEPGFARVRVVGAADRPRCERVAARAVERGLGISLLQPDVRSLEWVFAELTTSSEAPMEGEGEDSEEGGLS
jgi:ABC-2 type transport system ATP-binding protein